MNLKDLAEKTGMKIPADAVKASGIEIDRVYAGDKISDLLNEASAKTLLVTNLASNQLFRVAQLMDAPGICLVNGMDPDPALVKAATEHGTLLLVSPSSLFETCARLYQCLGGKPQSDEH